MKPTAKPTKPLDYAGNPYDPEKGETYGGRPEFYNASERMRKAREVLVSQPVTEETLAKKRSAMAHAREVWRLRKMKAKDRSTVEGDRE